MSNGKLIPKKLKFLLKIKIWKKKEKKIVKNENSQKWKISKEKKNCQKWKFIKIKNLSKMKIPKNETFQKKNKCQKWKFLKMKIWRKQVNKWIYVKKERNLSKKRKMSKTEICQKKFFAKKSNFSKKKKFLKIKKNSQMISQKNYKNGN